MSTTRTENRHRQCHGTAQQPVVSVVMPVYNGAADLAPAVASVLGQSLTNLEIIIVDDGSTDDTAAVAERLAAEDSRIRVFRQDCNRGQAAARNVALDRARGRWVALVDADDEITEDRLRTLTEAGDAADADLIADSVAFTGPLPPGSPRELRAATGPAPQINNPQTTGSQTHRPQTLSLETLIRSDIPQNGLCSFGYLKPLIRRDFLDRWQLRYDEDLRFAEDLNFFVRTLMCGGRFVLYPHILYIYKQTTPISVSRNVGKLPRRADDAIVNNRRMRELAVEYRLTGLDALFDEHEQRWSTVLWFDRLKQAVRSGRVGAAIRLMLAWPSSLGVVRFARDRALLKVREAP